MVIHEMLTGRPPFAGRTAVDIAHAVVYEQPPPLPPGAAPAAFEAAVRAALAKDPVDRPQSAAAFAAALVTDADSTAESALTAPAPAVTRLVVLPFRLLKPDPETDFLGFSLADAIAASLAGIESIVVRSSLTAAPLAGPSPDLRAIASQAGVDVALTGSLLRVGSQVRVTAQLLELPQGSLLWSRTIQAPVEDLFQPRNAFDAAAGLVLLTRTD